MANTKWFIISIVQILTATGYRIVITTDVPCHLWMRWTIIKPQEHLIPVIRRGVAFRSDKYFCFDVYHDNEQEEAGDTLIHTFIKEPWPVCETRYFYFHGEIAGVASKSTTTIFKKHRTLEAYGPPVWVECPQHGNAVYLQAKDSDWAVVQTKDPYYLGYIALPHHLTNFNTIDYEIRRCPFAYDTTAVPIGSLVVDAYFHWYGRYFGLYTPPDHDHWAYVLDFPAWDLSDDPSWYAYCNGLTLTACEIYVLTTWNDAWRDHPLTLSGMAKIVPGGITKYCITTRHDVLNLNPGVGNRNYQLRQPLPIPPPKLFVQYKPLL